jgi:serine protease inhibitor
MMIRCVITRLFTFGLLATLGACADQGTTSPASATPALTALPRDLTPAERGVLNASNAFSFALWKRVNTGPRDSNVFVSPLSASFSLGMAMNGAANQTLDDMRTGLQFGTTTLADIDAGYKSLIGLLTTLDPTVTMDIANSIWYRNTFSFNQSFLDDGTNYFGATVKPLDFANTSASLAAINGWVNTQTKGKIPTILDAIEPENVMFLINAIYFKGSWRTRFDPAQTSDAAFHAASGDQTARLMHRHDTMLYAESPTYQAVDLPYGDSAFTMTVVLPKPGTTVESLAASLDPGAWQALTSNLQRGDVDLYVPKLKISWVRDLIPDLKALGMIAPFADGADFTRMSVRGRELFISTVRQKTYVEVTEEGTEAAAVTNTGISTTAARIPSVIRVDRPFVFVIRERLSGTVLFMGKVVKLP